MKNQKIMEQGHKYMVATRCFTFNHAPYIEDAMNGFVMQETTFPVVTLIVDDASIDGEPEVIRKYLADHFQPPYRTEETEYAKIICAKHKTNANCDFVVFLLKYNHYSIKKPKMPYLSKWLDNAKYHALCEGDDYWTDPTKLQKQVDFMDANPDYTLCFHAVYEKFEGKSRLNKIRAKIDNREYSGIEWYKNRPSQTASFCFCRWITLDPFYKGIINNRKFIAGDVPLLLSCAHLGKIRGMSDVMSVYRHNETGWTQKKHSKESIIRIAESELQYESFGEEYKSQGESFYCLALVRAFFNTIVARDKSIDYDYVKLAWHKSKRKTITSFFILAMKLTKKYLKI